MDAHVGKHILSSCILSYCQDKTVLLITHQLNVAQHADHVVVVDDGRIMEQGTFESLMTLGGFFAKLMEELSNA